MTFLATFISSQAGIESAQARHLRLKIHTTVVDPHLDSKKVVVPGLGDFGNRYFGT